MCYPNVPRGLPWCCGILGPASLRHVGYHLSGSDRCTVFPRAACSPQFPLPGGLSPLPFPCFSQSSRPCRQQTLCSLISGWCPERVSWRNVFEARCLLLSGLCVNTSCRGGGLCLAFPRHLHKAAKSLYFRLSLSLGRSLNAAWRRDCILYFSSPSLSPL